MNTITNSSMSCFKECRRKFFYSYVKLIRLKQDKPCLRIGSAVHEGLDVLAKGGDINDALIKLGGMYGDQKIYSDEQGLELQYECVTAQTLVEQYQIAWAGQNIQIIESEKVFDLPIYNPTTGMEIRVFRKQGKKDRICKLPDGRTALMETKTTSEDISPDSDFRRMTILNQQVSLYMLACKEEGKPVSTCVYDVIRKPSIKPTAVPILDDNGCKIVIDVNKQERIYNANGKPRQTASTADGYIIQTRPMTADEWREKLTAEIVSQPDKYFQRFEVPRLSNEISEFAHELYDTAKDIHECGKTGRYYRTTAACRKWQSMCPYYEFCTGQASIDRLPERFRISDVEHEELIEE